MTISTAPTPISYSGNGSTTEFAVTWAYVQKSHVVATLRDSSGVETVQVLDTDYTLTDAGVSGTLTMTTAPAAGETLLITLEPPNTQSTDFPSGGVFPASAVEAALDVLTQIAQKIQSLFGRALRVPKTDTQSDTDLELPIDSERANKFLAFDSNGKVIASTGPTGDSSIPVSSFIETFIDDVDAPTARATLGAAADEDAVLSGKVSNYGLAFSVAASALTVDLKTLAGTDPSASDKVLAGFRSSTLANATSVVRTITAALTLVISNNSTLGHTSNEEGALHWYLIDNAGTPELAVSGKYHGRSGIISTTAEGGAGAADDGEVMYSTTARTDVAFLWIGETLDTQTTAGTWAAVPTTSRLVNKEVVATTSREGIGFLPKGWISGLNFTPPGSSANMPISAGQVVDSTGVKIFNVAALTKTTSSFVAGDAAGGLDTGSIASSTTYHWFAIYNPTTDASDILCSLSATSPTMPSGFTLFRRIGSWRTDGSSQWYAGWSRGNKFNLETPVNDISDSATGTSANTGTMTSVPTGVVVDWNGYAGIRETSSAAHGLVSSLKETDSAPTNTNGLSNMSIIIQVATTNTGTGYIGGIELNTSAQLRYRTSVDCTVYLTTLGWTDLRDD